MRLAFLFLAWVLGCLTWVSPLLAKEKKKANADVQKATAEALAKCDLAAHRVTGMNSNINKPCPGKTSPPAEPPKEIPPVEILDEKVFAENSSKDPCELAPPNPKLEHVKKDGATSYQKGIDATVLTEKQARYMFGRITEASGQLQTGDPNVRKCDYRAEWIATRLESRYGIRTTKFFAETGTTLGNLMRFSLTADFSAKLLGEKERKQMPWNFHVAVAVLVKLEGQEKPVTWILDPVLEPQKPRTVEEWKADISETPNRLNVSETSRHAFWPPHIHEKRKCYGVGETQAYRCIRNRDEGFCRRLKMNPALPPSNFGG
jgi:hypothetical protein